MTSKEAGLLRGYVDHVCISDDNGLPELAIESVDGVGVLNYWDTYGFEWGHLFSDSIQRETFDEKYLANTTKKMALDGPNSAQQYSSVFL